MWWIGEVEFCQLSSKSQPTLARNLDTYNFLPLYVGEFKLVELIIKVPLKYFLHNMSFFQDTQIVNFGTQLKWTLMLYTNF